jgi:hypothetical protein
MAKRKQGTNVLAMIESKMTKASVRRSDAKAAKMLLALRLAEFRKSLEMDQSAVKGFSQPAVSKIEGRGDIKLSTLVEYCRGLGAEIEITAKSDDKRGGKSFVLLKSRRAG